MARSKDGKHPGDLDSRVGDMIAVMREHTDGPGVYVQEVRHDDDCPALSTQSLLDCTCQPEFRQPKKLA